MYRIKFDSSGGELSNSTVPVSFLEGDCIEYAGVYFGNSTVALTLGSEGVRG